MRIIDHPQGSPEWKKARAGLPTASCFHKIITPAKGELSKQSDGYLARLVAEWFLGEPIDDGSTAFMDRGRELEPDAVKQYAWDYDTECRTVGLCLRDDDIAGASPDRLVGDDGLLEIKCPSAAAHMGYLLHGVESDYRCQVQGQLWVTGREWVDLYIYHPTLPRTKVRTHRDEEFITKLGFAVISFAGRLMDAKADYADAKAAFDAEQAERARLAQEAVPAMLS